MLAPLPGVDWEILDPQLQKIGDSKYLPGTPQQIPKSNHISREVI